MVETPQRPGTVFQQPGISSKTARPAPQVNFPDMIDNADELAELFREYDSNEEEETHAGNSISLALQIHFFHTGDERTH